jgi:hypothetical protein
LAQKTPPQAELLEAALDPKAKFGGDAGIRTLDTAFDRITV